MLETLLTIFHYFICIFLILVVLLQAGKGGGMGAFGGAGTQTVFGGSGAGNLLTKLTSISAGLFMLTSTSLAYLATASGKDGMIEIARQQQSRSLAKRLAEDKLLIDAGPDAVDLDAGPASGEVPSDIPPTDVQPGAAPAGEPAVVPTDKGVMKKPAADQVAPADKGSVEKAPTEKPPLVQPPAKKPAALEPAPKKAVPAPAETPAPAAPAPVAPAAPAPAPAPATP